MAQAMKWGVRSPDGGLMNLYLRCSLAVMVFGVMVTQAQQPASAPAPQPTTEATAPTRDTSYIDAQGTAHVTRVVPVPNDLSPESRWFLSRAEPDQGPPQSLEESRKGTDR